MVNVGEVRGVGTNGSRAGSTGRSLAQSVPSDRLDRLASMVTTVGEREVQRSCAPFDGGLVGEVPVCAADDVAEAARRARLAQQDWARRPVAERCEVMLRFHDLVLAHQAELLDLAQIETGKSRLSALEECLDVAMTARYYAHAAPRLLRPSRRQGAVPLLTRTVVHHPPEGLVGVISPVELPAHPGRQRRGSRPPRRQRHRPQARLPDPVHRAGGGRAALRGRPPP